MRGSDQRIGSLFSYVDIEARIAPDHPLRLIRELINDALAQRDAAFDRLYAEEGRPSIPLERLLRASPLRLFYSIRSERQLMERLDFDLLFHWFVGLGIDGSPPSPLHTAQEPTFQQPVRSGSSLLGEGLGNDRH